MTTLTGLAGAAVELAERGYHIFPCKPRDKRPLTSHGFKDATRDERTILHWWDRNPDANIGIACDASGVAVLDIDAKHGANPNEILKDRVMPGLTIVQTGTAPPRDQSHPRSLEGQRGAQVYFRGHMRTGDTTLPGVEIRGDGAYVVAPPSIHPSGVAYGPSLPLPVTSLLDVPDWVHAIVKAEPAGPAPVIGDVIPKGEQHKTLVSMAGTMRRRGMNAEEIEAALQVANHRCEEPAPPANIREIARSVAKYPPGQPIAGTRHVELASSAKEAAARLSALLMPKVGHHIVSARVYGKGSTASLEIDISNGETMTFGTLREMMRPQSLIAEVAACTGDVPQLKQIDCAVALTLARQVATVVEIDSENDIAREWGRDFLELAEHLDLDITDQKQRWGAFEHLAHRRPWSTLGGPGEQPEAPLVLRHEDGTRFVRTLWFERYVKHRDSSVSRTSIGARMGRVGWSRRGRHGDIKATAPGRKEVRIYPFWVVPDGWEEPEVAAA